MPNHTAPFYIVMNAGSGHEETDLRTSTITDVLNGAGRAFHLRIVEHGNELADIAAWAVREARANNGVVVAAGGDGTINTVAHQAVGSGCPFAVLPQGTYNYFARTHGIPEDLGDAVRALLDARTEAVQIGMVNNRVFLVNASIGLYPTILEEREIDKKQYGRSRLVALLSALKTILGSVRQMRIVIEQDGVQRKLRTPTLFVGNNRLQMEQVGITPMSEALEDGELAALAPKTAGSLALLGLFLRGALGRLGEAEDVVVFSFKRMTVKKRKLPGRPRIKVATDGEVNVMTTPLEFKVVEGKLLLLKPAPVPAPDM
ncbi:diacylglycerol/lipid kinase family protein [Pseudoduganella namucuonensis]|uniref:Diacylglycerol kinase family enzyme n=1 Tax=Pseudoduganella namucuonensis TaxID=1035707 RepID=A0A1I7HMX3_9BURK|nr:diacylglycerol kinase family protein [Pseudoduganella namucuonensis]SFU62114.1 Diacylglycerol kinase family enzyme [Pseudoduganella namucuonensis]